jgi:hypothetical protein
MSPGPTSPNPTDTANGSGTSNDNMSSRHGHLASRRYCGPSQWRTVGGAGRVIGLQSLALSLSACVLVRTAALLLTGAPEPEYSTIWQLLAIARGALQPALPPPPSFEAFSNPDPAEGINHQRHALTLPPAVPQKPNRPHKTQPTRYALRTHVPGPRRRAADPDKMVQR